MAGRRGERSLSSIVQIDDDEADLSHSTSSKDSIRRIPYLFKMRNEKAYTPYKFSIGPWHYGKTELLCTGQKLKESSLEGLLARFTDRAVKRIELEEAISSVHDRARKCYDGGDVYFGGEDTDEARRKFEKILLLDGCFIIELFRKHAREVSPSDDDDVSFRLTRALSQVLYHDLLLLDNQIPWFVLKLLFDKTKNTSVGQRDQSLVELAFEFFKEAFPHYRPRELFGPQSRHDLNYLHLVHFVWRFWVVLSRNELFTFVEWDYRTVIPSATRLKEAGVKFKKVESGHILNVKFNEGVFEIGPLLITPLTENIFRNFIIFEQYSIFSNSYVTCYAILLDCLINTSDDVDLMSRTGVFVNRLNPEETVNFFNRVRDNTNISRFCYAPLYEEVNRYCDRTWPRWRASLNRHMNQPWAIVSAYFAMSSLVAAIMQLLVE